MVCLADAARAELVRLASFSTWPAELAMTTVSFVCLAAAGFSYTGSSDVIECNHCGAVVRGWTGTRHSPLLEHRCLSKPDSHYDKPAEHYVNISTPGSYKVTADNWRRTVPEPETDVTSLSFDKAARGSDAVKRDDDRFTKTLGVPLTSGVAASLLMDVDDVTAVKTTSGDVRDAAAAALSKLRLPY